MSPLHGTNACPERTFPLVCRGDRRRQTATLQNESVSPVCSEAATPANREDCGMALVVTADRRRPGRRGGKR